MASDTHMPGPGHTPPMVGFQTGNAKAVVLTAAAMERAEKMMQQWQATDEDQEAQAPMKLDVNQSRSSFAPAATRHVSSVSPMPRSASPPSPPRPAAAPPAEFIPSFSTGRGVRVTVTAAAEERARKMMTEVDAEIDQQHGGMRTAHDVRSDTQAPAASTASSNHVAGGFSSSKPFRAPASIHPRPSSHTASRPNAADHATSMTAAAAPTAATDRTSTNQRQSKMDLLDAHIASLESDMAEDGEAVEQPAGPTASAISAATSHSTAASPHPDTAASTAFKTPTMLSPAASVQQTIGHKRTALSQVPEETSQQVETMPPPYGRLAPPAAQLRPSSPLAIASSSFPLSSPVPHASLAVPSSASMPPLCTPSPVSGVSSAPPTMRAGDDEDPPMHSPVHKRARTADRDGETPTITLVSLPTDRDRTHSPIPIASFDAASPPASATRVIAYTPSSAASPIQLLSPDGGSVCIPATPSLESQAVSLEMQFDQAADQQMMHPNQQSMKGVEDTPEKNAPQSMPSSRVTPTRRVQVGGADDYLPPSCFRSPAHATLAPIVTFATTIM